MPIPDWQDAVLATLTVEEKAAAYDLIMEDCRGAYAYHTARGMRPALSPPWPLSLCKSVIRDAARLALNLRGADDRDGGE